MEQSQESGKLISIRGWLIVILVAALIVLWGFFNYAFVKDPLRSWHFGALPDAPSESVYSTEAAPQSATPPLQSPMLPEAQPKQPPGGKP